MELWIRSQSKQTLIKAEKVFIEDEEVYATTNSEFNERIGVYKSKERALEILNEIQDRLINIQIYMKDEEVLKHNNPLYPYMECVYEMPKE